MMKKSILLFLISFSMTILAQNKSDLPFYEIPKAEQSYTAQSTTGRIVDALGFRFYWSSFGLTDKDLSYKISAESRSCQETIIHIYDLTTTILRLTKIDFKQSKEKSEMSFSDLRSQTLLNIDAISKAIKASKDLAEFDLKKDGKITVSFFNIINGPIADAIWHTGQLAVFRRASGNPINPKVNHFSGTVRE